jgi:hypothetical protein
LAKIRAIFWGLAQALVTTFVCGIAIGAVARLQVWESPRDGYWDDLAFLLIFVASALISASVVLAYPAYLVFQQRVREGFLLLFSTIGWLVLILVGIIGIIAIV